jgi:dihydroflavonol-4-reductase
MLQGQRYLGSGHFVSLARIADILREGLGKDAKKIPTRKIPNWLVKLVGLFDSEVRGQLFELGKVRRCANLPAPKPL